MQNISILWVDDEIGMLKPHIMFLEQKGMRVLPVTNGQDAIEAVRTSEFDIIFLDENMPGMSGLETLSELKTVRPRTPVVMITKSEEEHIMDDAIGSKIADYLIKPVNPNQILLSCKKILEGSQLVSQKVNMDYQRDFRKIGMAFDEATTPEEWSELYKKLVFWERELESSQDKSMKEVYAAQKMEANINFTKFIKDNYEDWVQSKPEDRPILSPDVVKMKVFPHLAPEKQVLFFIVVDCLRFDQWKVFEPIFARYFNIVSEETYFSILPTATQYARNAIFSGLFPDEIAKKFPKYWVYDDEEGGKNLHEAELLKEQIMRARLNIKYSYHKVITNEEGAALADNVLNLMRNDFNVLVYNFIDLLSHARSEMNIIKELAPDEAALRGLTNTWLEHSSLHTVLKKLKDQQVKIVLSTDHGTIRVKRPIKIIGDRTTTTNLRYKHGRNLNYDDKTRQIYTVSKPSSVHLPSTNITGSYAFACEDGFFVYPNNYNYYVNFYNDTFQHGGISLEEMIVPIITMVPK